MRFNSNQIEELSMGCCGSCGGEESALIKDQEVEQEQKKEQSQEADQE